MNKKHEVSELRQDLVSGEWIIIAPYRLKRPGDLIKKVAAIAIPSIKLCRVSPITINGTTAFLS